MIFLSCTYVIWDSFVSCCQRHGSSGKNPALCVGRNQYGYKFRGVKIVKGRYNDSSYSSSSSSSSTGFYYPLAGFSLLILEVSRSHTRTHNSRYDCSGRVIGPLQRPLPDKTQHSQQTNIHAPGGIRTRHPRRRPAADPRLRQI
jgi:hypothetical protein